MNISAYIYKPSDISKVCLNKGYVYALADTVCKIFVYRSINSTGSERITPFPKYT